MLLLSNSLRLENHGFELHGSPSMQIFFNSKYYSPTGSKFIELVDVEPQILGDSRYKGELVNNLQIFNCAEGWCP